MSRAEKTTFVSCSFFLIAWLAFTFFFPNQHAMLGTFAKNPHAVLENWRFSFNAYIKNIERSFALDDIEYERLISTSYTMIYKREYEQLREYLSIREQMDPSELIHTVFLINTVGTRDAEILRVASDDTIPLNGFLISPALSTVIGKIKVTRDNTAEIIPIWNEHFNAQVSIKEKENETAYSDLALIENKQVINFNPAFPYKVGDGVYLSKYEPGGYTLSRYEWSRIGSIAPVKQNEIVEKYGIEYDYTREEILEERFFFVVE